jgi:transcriptional regulator with XRE-family HTH domain
VAIGLRLDITCRALGLSQVEFATRANLSQNAVSQYINGVNRPNLDAAIALCDAHKLTLDWIYFGDQSGLRMSLADAIAALRRVETEGQPSSKAKRRRHRAASV